MIIGMTNVPTTILVPRSPFPHSFLSSQRSKFASQISQNVVAERKRLQVELARTLEKTGLSLRYAGLRDFLAGDRA
jgi:hypothetical protein